MEINIQVAKYEEKCLLRMMLELYAYDCSKFENTDLNELGVYGYRYLDLYWIEPERFPFILRISKKLAGFALVNKFAYKKNVDYTIAEFFVLKKYRNQGIGKKLAFHLFDTFTGEWEIRTKRENHDAVTFWSKVIKEYAEESMKEFPEGISNYKNPIWTFKS